jgi:ribosome maturation factor RimP
VNVADRVRAIVEPLLESRAVELFDVEHSGSTLRITVDQSGGIGLDELGELTKAISRALDERDPMPGRYTLEVSSPGLERPLRRPEHFARALGETVAIRTHPGIEPRRVTGVVVASDDAGVTVRSDDAGELRLDYHDIERARTVFAWGGPAPKPGKTPKKKVHQ